MRKKQEESIWQQRKKTLLYLIILVIVVMVMIMTVRYIVDYVADNGTVFSGEESEEKYNNMYNASRYFFRLYYPDNWHVNTESNGFMVDETQGLVLELFPMIRILTSASPGEVTPSPSPTPGGSPAADRLAGMMRDPSLTASFYYCEYTEEQKAWIAARPAATPMLTEELAEPLNKTDRELLEKIADEVYAQITENFDPEVYTWGRLQTLETTDITFRYFTYNYSVDGAAHTADLYIAVRASNYYQIVYDGVSTELENAYRSHRADFLSIMEEFRFSVFKD